MPERNPASEHSEVRYEKSDAQIGGIIAFGGMLAVIGLIVYLSVAWLFVDLKEREDRKYQPLPSLAAKERVQLPQGLNKIHEPRLQKSEPLDLARLREEEDSSLNTYGWVDPKEGKEGFVRIPIEEAMKLLADPKTAAANGIRVRSLKEGKK